MVSFSERYTFKSTTKQSQAFQTRTHTKRNYGSEGVERTLYFHFMRVDTLQAINESLIIQYNICNQVRVFGIVTILFLILDTYPKEMTVLGQNQAKI